MSRRRPVNHIVPAWAEFIPRRNRDAAMMAASAPPELDAAACAAWLGRLGVGERGDERVRCAGRVTARRRVGPDLTPGRAKA